jgi:hypothetical protein
MCTRCTAVLIRNNNSVYLASATTGSADIKVLSLCSPAPNQNTLVSSKAFTSGAAQHAHNPKVSNAIMIH